VQAELLSACLPACTAAHCNHNMPYSSAICSTAYPQAGPIQVVPRSGYPLVASLWWLSAVWLTAHDTRSMGICHRGATLSASDNSRSGNRLHTDKCTALSARQDV